MPCLNSSNSGAINSDCKKNSLAVSVGNALSTLSIVNLIVLADSELVVGIANSSHKFGGNLGLVDLNLLKAKLPKKFDKGSGLGLTLNLFFNSEASGQALMLL